MFFGRSIGGIGTTNHFLLLIAYILFIFIPSYKKEIPCISLITYIIMIIISTIFNQSIIINIHELINSEFLFGIIFIATIPNYSPIVFKDKVIYSILIGIISFIFNKLINPFEGIFIAILIANIIMIIINKIRMNKHENE